jgi:cbb3-type cytochrome oxidase subunit 3
VRTFPSFSEEKARFFMMAKTHSTPASSSLLRNALQVDGVVSAIGALGFLAVGISPLATLMGFGGAAFPLIVCVVLVAYVAWLYWLTRKPKIESRQAMTVVVINDAWVVGSIVLLIINQPPLTLFGKLFIGLIAVVVAAFSGVEFYAVRKQRQAF